MSISLFMALAFTPFSRMGSRPIPVCQAPPDFAVGRENICVGWNLTTGDTGV